jgi:hypothetical protein
VQVARTRGITLPTLPDHLTESLTAPSDAGADAAAGAELEDSAAADSTAFERLERSPEPSAIGAIDSALSHNGHAAAGGETILTGELSGASGGISSAHARTVPLRNALDVPEQVEESSSAAMLGASTSAVDADDDVRVVAPHAPPPPEAGDLSLSAMSTSNTLTAGEAGGRDALQQRLPPPVSETPSDLALDFSIGGRGGEGERTPSPPRSVRSWRSSCDSACSRAQRVALVACKSVRLWSSLLACWCMPPTLRHLPPRDRDDGSAMLLRCTSGGTLACLSLARSCPHVTRPQ